MLSDTDLALAAQQNMQLECLDFIQTSPIPYNDEGIDWSTVDALVFTSSNAVRYFYDAVGVDNFASDKIIFSLSGKTAKQFAVYGLAPTYTSTNASFLCDAIVGMRGIKSVVHICGNLKLGVVETRLTASGINYKPLTVYRTNFIETMPFQQQFDVVMFYSPSGVDSYVTKNKLNEDTVYCCVGVTTADALRDKKNHLKILIPESPSPEAMIDVVSRYYKTRQIATWPS